MKSLLSIFILFSTISFVYSSSLDTNRKSPLYSEDDYRTEFSNWIAKFEKKYESLEFIQRFAIFKTNMDYVRDWNAVNRDTVLELNKFADLSNQEYRKTYLGTQIDGRNLLGTPGTHQWIQNRISHNMDQVFGKQLKKIIVSATTNPTSIDWREKGAVSHIKDQGQCGSCYTFSTTGSTEGAHQIKTGNMVDLSEQNLVDCSGKEGNEGCNGGLMNNCFEYIIKNGGIDTETSYPYDAMNGKRCLFNHTNIGATISSFKNITSGSEKELENAVAFVGPVSVAIDASHNSFQLYSSGIYYEKECSSTALDHGVLVVGYGSGNPPKVKPGQMIRFHQDSTQNYWIVKNSWGTSWGDMGYIYMSKDRDNNCGISTSASYPLI